MLGKFCNMLLLFKVTVSLVREIMVIAHNTHTHCSSNVVTSMKHCNIAPRGEHLWRNEGLKVPPIAPSLNNRILNIMYFLALTVSNKGIAVHLNCASSTVGSTHIFKCFLCNLGQPKRYAFE